MRWLSQLLEQHSWSYRQGSVNIRVSKDWSGRHKPGDKDIPRSLMHCLRRMLDADVSATAASGTAAPETSMAAKGRRARRLESCMLAVWLKVCWE